MKIQYISDIHLEHIKPSKLSNFINNIKNMEVDVLVLAGDIGKPNKSYYKTFMDYISTNFKKTFVITGNHEYYNDKYTIDEINKITTEFFEQYDNITFLNNSFEYYKDYCFVGTTLWSKVTNPKVFISDIDCIPYFDCDKYNKLNETCVSFLNKTIQEHQNCIVITHHVPLKNLIHKKYMTFKMLPYNQWFYSDLDTIIKENKDNIKCWFYGHTHTPSTNYVYDIPFLCNPIGYPHEMIEPEFNKIFNL